MPKKHSKAPTVNLDSNIIIHYLTGYNAQLGEKAKQLFLKAHEGKLKLRVTPTTLAEVYYALTSSIYKMPFNQAVEILTIFLKLKGVYAEHKKIVVRALELISKHNLPFIDAYNLAYSLHYGYALATFDRKLYNLYKQYTQGNKSKYTY